MTESEFAQALPIALRGARRVFASIDALDHWEDIAQEVALYLWRSDSVEFARLKGRTVAIDWLRKRYGRNDRQKRQKGATLSRCPYDDVRHGAHDARMDLTRLDAHKAIRAALQPEEEYVLLAWALGQRTQAEIAREIGRTCSRVCQIIRRALIKLESSHATAPRRPPAGPSRRAPRASPRRQSSGSRTRS